MDGESTQSEMPFQSASGTEAVNGLTCSVCGSAEFFAENQGELEKCPISISIQHAILCHNCLVTAKHARDGKSICDLPHEVLALIFQYFMPIFWFDTIRSVCIPWCTIVDHLCKSFRSISCYKNSALLLSSYSKVEYFDELCTDNAVYHFVENSAQQMKRFSLQGSNMSNDIKIYHLLQKCSNLAELTLSYDLESNLEKIKMLSFPNLKSLTLEFFQMHCINDDETLSRHAKIVREVLAHFLSKSTQISGLGFERFTSHFDLFPLICNLNLKSLNLSGLFDDTNNNLQPGLELAVQLSQSLDSLKFSFPYASSLDHTKVLPCLLKLCEANKLTTLNWTCYVPISDHFKIISPFWSEVIVFGLAGLSNLNELYLAHLDLTFRPSLQQNWRTAGRLLAPTFQALTSLHLMCCLFDDLFLEQAFSSRLPNLHYLIMSTERSLSHSILLRLLGEWCPNLAFLIILPSINERGIYRTWSKELLTDVHKVVHTKKCRHQSSGALNLQSLKWFVIVVYGMIDMLENFEKWGLCSVRKVRKEPDADYLCICREDCL